MRHPEADLLLAFALGEIDPADRMLLEAHLDRCPSCRGEVDQLSGTVRQLLAGAPSVAPSEGFAGRVVAAMVDAGVPARDTVSVGDTSSLVASRSPATRRRAVRTRLLVGAAAAVGLVAGVAGTIGVETLPARAPASAASSAVASVPLVTSAGDAVGRAGVVRVEDRSYLVLVVDGGVPGASYECVLVGRDGRRTSGGTWRLAAVYGSGRGSGSWLVPLTGEPPASVELVAPSGTVWSRGTF